MRSRTLLLFILVISSTTSLFSQNSESLGDTARRLRAEKAGSQQAQKPSSPSTGSEKSTPPSAPQEPYLTNDATPSSGNAIDSADPVTYQAAVRSLLNEEKFNELDRIAAKERSTKSRFPGGGWKLYTFYTGLCGSQCEATPEPELQDVIEHLKHWVSAKPGSVTARIALANAYYDYAWSARGSGYADTVNDTGWKLYGERIQLARTTLDEAARLQEKCPHWYYVMLGILRSQQADLSEISAVVEKASSVEPLYYYTYSDYAFTLQPRWYGEEGDSEKFAEAISKKIGGEEGAIIYFNIAADLNCVGCSEAKSAFSQMSWPKIQEGYASLERRYGLSKIKLNTFAHLAVRAEDHPVATKAFLRIGQNWDKAVWHEKTYFDSSRGWALAPPPEFISTWNEADRSAHREGGMQYMQQTVTDFQQRNSSVIKECTQLIRDDTEPFWVVMKLDQNGNAQDLAVWPPTKLSACVIPKLARHAATPPPAHPFWLISSFMNKPTPEPVSQHIRGAMFPEPVATTPLPKRIVGDLNADATIDPEAMAKYVVAVRELLNESKFDELDKIANSARKEKARFSGGIWKLYVLYQGLKQPAEGIKAAEPVWQNHLDILKAWALSRPESVTARVALAEALLNYSAKIFSEGDKPRSDGQDPWARTQAVRHLVELTMNEIAAMKTKCPHFFFVKLEIQGLQNRDKLAPAFEEAVSFEPEYLPYYRIYAIYQRPEWNGDDGDAQNFANEISNRVGAKNGDALYYEIATALNISPGTRYFPTVTLSWDRIRVGYSSVEKLYGPSLFNLNQLALLAVRYGQTAAEKELIGKIGDRWNFETWKSQQYFEFVREYVTPPPELETLRQEIAVNAATDAGRQYQQQVYYEVGVKIAPILKECVGPLTGAPIRGNDLFFQIAADGTIQDVKGWPETNFNSCAIPSLINAKISRPPSPSYWVQIPFAPNEGTAAMMN